MNTTVFATTGRGVTYRPRRYGLSNLVGDVVLTGVTGGIWLVWVLIREFRQ